MYHRVSTIQNDWDVAQAIATTCERMHIVPFFHHAKGHQDDKTEYSKLSLETQLDVDADPEAGYYHHVNLLDILLPLFA
jgi:hypothetical protein